MNLKRMRVGFTSILMLGLAACGGGGGDSGGTTPPPPIAAKTGAFQISNSTAGGVCGKCGPVANVAYTTTPAPGGAKAARSGVTNALGQFQYDEGDGVNFTLGGIDLGSAQAGTEVTVADIAEAELAAGTPPANTDEGDYATNLTQFLLTYDQDGNPDNGITIAAETVAASASVTILFEQPLETFDDEGGDFDDFNQQTTTEPASQEAAEETLDDGATARLAGTWVAIDAQGNYKTDAIVTFFDNGYYLFGATDASPPMGCQTTTLEYGRFTYDGASSSFRTSTPSLYTNTIGSGNDYYCDSIHVSAQEQENSEQKLELGSDTLTFSFDALGQPCAQDETALSGGRCGNVLKRAPSGTGVAGSWLTTPIAEANSAPGVFVFFGNTSGRYIFVDSRSEMPGVESGTFSIDANNILTAVHSGSGNFDSNGDNGINESDRLRVFVSPSDSRRLNFVDSPTSNECATEGECYVTRLPQVNGETRPQPQQDQLVGSWGKLNANNTIDYGSLLSFFSNGTYLLGAVNNEPGCNMDPGETQTPHPGAFSDANGNGIEYGKYSWNPATGAFSVGEGTGHRLIRETDGFCGFNEPFDASTNDVISLSIAGDTLTFTQNGTPATYQYQRIPSQPSQINGTFLYDGSLLAQEPIVFGFYPNAGTPNSGVYLMLDATANNPAWESAGMEQGCYSINPSTDVVTADLSANCPNVTDTNDEAGLSHPQAGEVLHLKAISNQKLQASGGGDDFTFSRLPLAGDDKPQPAALQPQSAVDFVGTYQVTAGPPASTKLFITFLQDGRYIKGGKEGQASCGSINHSSNPNAEANGDGYEIGTWSYTASSNTLTTAVTDDTDGDCGLGNGSITGWSKASNGSLSFTTEEGTFVQAPVTSTSNSLVGAWHFAGEQGVAGTPQAIASMPKPLIVVFKADNTYSLINIINAGDPDCGAGGNGGVEQGSFAFNSGTGAFSLSNMTLDTDGGCGFNDPNGNPVDTITLNSSSQFTLTRGGNGSFVFTKLTAP